MFTTVYSLAFFLVMRLLIESGQAWSILFMAVAVVGSLIWTAILASAVAFTANRTGTSILLLILPPLTLLTAAPLSMAALIGMLFVAASVFTAQQAIQQEIKSRVMFKVAPIFRGGIRILIFGLVVAIIVITVPLSRDAGRNSTLHVPDKYIAAILIPASPIIRNFIPNYTNQTTINDIIDAQVNQQIKSLPEGVELLPGQRDRARIELSRQLGINLAGSETVPHIAAAFINKHIEGLADGNRIIVIVAVVAIALLLFRTLAHVMVWPTLGLVAILVDVARRIGLISIIKTQVTVERMHL